MGVPIPQKKVSCLLYAYDATLVTEEEADLQVLLDVLQEWCVRWRMYVNVDKTAIMHFRPKRRQCQMLYLNTVVWENFGFNKFLNVRGVRKLNSRNIFYNK